MIATPSVEDVREKIADHLFYAADRKNLDGHRPDVEGYIGSGELFHIFRVATRFVASACGMEVRKQSEERIREQFQADNLTIDFYYALPPEARRHRTTSANS